MGRLTNLFSPSKMSNLVKKLKFKEKEEETVDERFLREFREYQSQEVLISEQEVDQLLPNDPMKKVEMVERSIKKEMWLHARDEFVKEEKKRLKRGEEIEKRCDIGKGKAKMSEIVEDKGPNKSLFDLLKMERKSELVIGKQGEKGEGQGDNYEGSSYTKSSSFSLLSSKYFACCSPLRTGEKDEGSFRSNEAYIFSESHDSSGTFSFSSPLESFPKTKQVGNWWPRNVWPSSNQSVRGVESWRWDSKLMLERTDESGQSMVGTSQVGVKGEVETSAECSYVVGEWKSEG